VAVRLALPPQARLHDVFHIGLLKKFHGAPPQEPAPLPPVRHGAVVPEPERVVKARLARGVRQVLIQWKGASPASSTWEDVEHFRALYPQFQLEDELPLEGGRDVMCGRVYTRRRRARDVRRAAERAERMRLEGEGPIRRTREGGSEWEPIKILLEGDGNSYKMNTASNTCLRLTTQVGQAHVATGVPLDLGTNTHTLRTRERSGTPNLESSDLHRSDQ
jgi:hypothetical protein